MGRPSFGLGRSRAQLRPPPPLKRPREPYLTTFTQATGAGGQYRRLSGPSPPPATVTTPRPLGSVPSGLCWFRDARESAPPPLRKMRMPRMWRAAASAAAPHSQPRGAWLKPRPARGDTGLGLLVGRPRPAPRRPYHVALVVAIVVTCCHPRRSSRERRLEPSFRTLSPAGRGSSHAPHMG